MNTESTAILPTRKNGKSKGLPPAKATTKALELVDPNKKAPCNFNTTYGKRMEMTFVAKERGLTTGEMLVMAFDYWKASL